MTSGTLDIIRRLGEAAPPPIRLSKLFQSPEQIFLSFSAARENLAAPVRVYEHLGRASVNIRFISKYMEDGQFLRVRLCVDSQFRESALEVFAKEEVAAGIRDSYHIPGAIILSLYPFGGQPQIAWRAFSALQAQQIEILAVNSGISVFSCVIRSVDLAAAISSLKQVFMFQ